MFHGSPGSSDKWAISFWVSEIPAFSESQPGSASADALHLQLNWVPRPGRCFQFDKRSWASLHYFGPFLPSFPAFQFLKTFVAAQFHWWGQVTSQRGEEGEPSLFPPRNWDRLWRLVLARGLTDSHVPVCPATPWVARSKSALTWLREASPLSVKGCRFYLGNQNIEIELLAFSSESNGALGNCACFSGAWFGCQLIDNIL